MDETALDKIKKLLRLAKSDNQHEAEVAMLKAMQMAAKHAVDLADLADEEHGPMDSITHEWQAGPVRRSREYRYACNMAVGYFHVTACFGHGRLLLVGRSEDIQIATWVINYLLKASRAGVSRYADDEAAHRRRMTTNKRASYLSAFFNAISWKLAGQVTRLQLEHPKFELVLRDQKERRNDVLDEVVPDRQQLPQPEVKRRNVSAAIAGHLDGKNTTVMPEVSAPKNTTTQPLLALT